MVHLCHLAVKSWWFLKAIRHHFLSVRTLRVDIYAQIMEVVLVSLGQIHSSSAPEGHTLGKLIIDLGTAILIIPVLSSYWKIFLYNPMIWKIYGSYNYLRSLVAWLPTLGLNQCLHQHEISHGCAIEQKKHCKISPWITTTKYMAIYGLYNILRIFLRSHWKISTTKLQAPNFGPSLREPLLSRWRWCWSWPCQWCHGRVGTMEITR